MNERTNQRGRKPALRAPPGAAMLKALRFRYAEKSAAFDALRAEVVRLEALSLTLKEWCDKFQAQRDVALDQRDEAMAAVALQATELAERQATLKQLGVHYQAQVAALNTVTGWEAAISKKNFTIDAGEFVADLIERIGPEHSAGDGASLAGARAFARTLANGLRATMDRVRAERDALMVASGLPDAEGVSLRFCASCGPPHGDEPMKPCEWREDTGMDPACWMCAECYADWRNQP